MNGMQLQKPPTWLNLFLGDIFIIERGGSPRPIEEYLTEAVDGLNWIKIGDTKGVTKYISRTKEKIKKEGLAKTRMVFEGDFILSNSMSFGRPYIMKICGCIHDGWLVIRNSKSSVSADYLYHILNSPFVYHQFEKLAKGSTVKNLNIEAVQKVEIFLPPLAEQHRIVAKIEELFSELDKGIESLKTAQEQLKVYRQAVLKYAFEGKLTNPNLKDSELPEGWVRDTLGNLFATTSGGTPSRKIPEYYTGSIPWVKSGELVNYRITKTEEYITLDAVKNSSAKVFPEGTLLIALYGATIGKLAFLGVNAATNQAVCAIFPSDKLNLTYMYFYLMHKKNQLIQSAVGGAQPNISQTILKDLFVQYPVDHGIQSQLISDIQAKFSICDKIEESIEQGLRQAVALRQSILKRAFEGKLVPQDPNDEPASVLLERIRAERNDIKPVKKTKRVKA